MSNRIKIKKQKPKEKDHEKAEYKEEKNAAKFLKMKQDRENKRSQFSNKTSKEYSRKKT
jgi:hypothetical protein